MLLQRTILPLFLAGFLGAGALADSHEAADAAEAEEKDARDRLGV